MNNDDHTMQTMMITPELLGLIPSGSSAPPSGNYFVLDLPPKLQDKKSLLFSNKLEKIERSIFKVS